MNKFRNILLIIIAGLLLVDISLHFGNKEQSTENKKSIETSNGTKQVAEKDYIEITFQEKIYSLYRGMPKSEVEKELGRPKNKQVSSYSETWEYEGSGMEDLTIHFDYDGKLESIMQI